MKPCFTLLLGLSLAASLITAQEPLKHERDTRSRKPPTTIQVTPSAWQTWYSCLDNGPILPLTLGAPGWVMQFPLSTAPTPATCDRDETGLFPGAWVGYQYTPVSLNLAIGTVINATGSITTTGSPVFQYLDNTDNVCVAPAAWRLWFWGTASSDGDGRWWYDPPVVLQAGPFNISAVINYDAGGWSNALGVAAGASAASMALFDEARTSVAQIGGTYGGGCFYGHGVNVAGGTAEFILNTYTATAP